jgi:hypothetical protein
VNDTPDEDALFFRQRLIKDHVGSDGYAARTTDKFGTFAADMRRKGDDLKCPIQTRQKGVGDRWRALARDISPDVE